MDENSNVATSGTFLKKILLFSSQIPLIIGWISFLQLSTDYLPNVPIAIGFSVIYELIIFVIAFGKKVWIELEKDAVKETADWIREYIRCFSPGFRKRYKKFLIENHGDFNVRGTGLHNKFRLKLNKVFIELRIEPRNPQKLSYNPISQTTPSSQNQVVWDFLRMEKSKKESSFALAIVGPPGCGKTTLLQNLVLMFAENRQRQYKLRTHLPIFLNLREHAENIVQNDPPLSEIVQQHFSNTRKFVTLKTPPKRFENKLNNTRCLILLDGLDEVSNVDQRRITSEWVDRQIMNHPQSRFILTARPQGYRDAPLACADIVLEILPLTKPQVSQFIENWYLANESVASGNLLNNEIKRKAKSEAEDLILKLDKNLEIAALTPNPLLLTMITMVHCYHGALPGSRIELYNEICQVLLGRWRQSKKIEEKLKAEQKLVVLRPLAAYMMENRIRDITLDEALIATAESLRTVGVIGDEARQFPVETQESSSLLLEREAGIWNFAHLTFQEFLTAAHWLDKKYQPDWGKLVGDSWWRETLLLYAAQGDATNLVNACLEINTIDSLSLALDCLEECLQVLPEVREEAENKLIAALNSENSSSRQIAAEVKLLRRVQHSFQVIKENLEFDETFITHAEYQLFIDDMLMQNEYTQPDHWKHYDFAEAIGKEMGSTPIRGIRANDAYNFCDWLTKKTGKEWIYRLPYELEKRYFLDSSIPDFAVWYSNPDADVFDSSFLKLSKLNRESVIHIDEYVSTEPHIIGSVKTRLDVYMSLEELGLLYETASCAFLMEAKTENDTVSEIFAEYLDRFQKSLEEQLRIKFGFFQNFKVHNQILPLALIRSHKFSFPIDLIQNFALANLILLSRKFVQKHLYIYKFNDFNILKDISKVNKSVAIREIELAFNKKDNKNYKINKHDMTLINILLEIYSSANQDNIRLYLRKLYATLFEISYFGAISLSKTNNQDINWSKIANEFADAGWLFHNLVAREEGKLIAWEGLQLFREKITSVTN